MYFDEEQWLAHYFATEVCAQCGWDADQHEVRYDAFDKPHAICLDPIPDHYSDRQFRRELAQRVAISTGATRKGRVHNEITGTVGGPIIQAGTIENGITFN
jgi:hypothetical protein